MGGSSEISNFVNLQIEFNFVVLLNHEFIYPAEINMVFSVTDFLASPEVKVFETLKKDDLIALGLYFGFDEE